MHVESVLPLSLTILQEVPQPVWVVDESGGILFANRAAVDTLGYEDPIELEGLPSHQTVHHSHGDGSPFPVAECRMLRPSVTGQPEHGDDYWFATKDGTLIPVSWWSAPIDLPSGKGVVTSFTDLTERHLLERFERERDAAEIRARESRAAQQRVMEATADIRRSTARDLHDGAQQRLVSLAILLSLAAEEITDNNLALRSLLIEASSEAQSAIDDLRELAAGVYPNSLTAGGLATAVDQLAARSPLPVQVDLDISHPLSASVQSHVYFVIAEALTNAIKHSAANVITIRGETAGPLLSVTIADDGVGGVDVTSGGLGLLSMRDRIEFLGGQLHIHSPIGAGTEVQLVVPADSIDNGD